MGIFKKDGEWIVGLQMVEIFNVMGFDYVIFGNYEFDFKIGELVEKWFDQSEFEYMLVNVLFVEFDQIK